MFLKDISVVNYRLFGPEEPFEINDLSVPDGKTEGTGINLVVGENGCGKSSLLEAISLPLLSYKADSFSINDLNDPRQRTIIDVMANDEFIVASSMPKGEFKSKGFRFEGGLRSRDTKAYLSSMVVTDQRFVKADGESKPSDNSPDLRMAVNNPFKGPRFNENDILYLDRNRTYQVRSGTFNKTRFDRLMEDFSFQYLSKFAKSKDAACENLSSRLSHVLDSSENAFLAQAIERFQSVTGQPIDVSFLNNWHPFENCFFAQYRENNHQIRLDALGSGYEMFFSLLYSFYLAQQSKKHLIVLLDEPELHLHPALQAQFVDIILEFATFAQFFICTHSPLLVKQLLASELVEARVLSNVEGRPRMLPIEDRLLPYLSANEVNYLAFDLATEEHHNELYEELKGRSGQDKIKDFDREYFQTAKGGKPEYALRGLENQVTLHTYVRNQIHHRNDLGAVSPHDLRASIVQMREFLSEDCIGE